MVAYLTARRLLPKTCPYFRQLGGQAANNLGRFCPNLPRSLGGSGSTVSNSLGWWPAHTPGGCRPKPAQDLGCLGGQAPITWAGSSQTCRNPPKRLGGFLDFQVFLFSLCQLTRSKPGYGLYEPAHVYTVLHTKKCTSEVFSDTSTPRRKNRSTFCSYNT
jgi:hypothetical protein